ncbi:MAG: uroporphyrinogen decarboxylase family protein [Acidimicrobiia bacterium]
MSVVFAPSLGDVTGFLAHRTLKDLSDDPANLTRAVLDAARRTGATHVLFPFDSCVLAEACGVPIDWSGGGPTLGSPTRDVSPADLEPQEVMMAGRVPFVLQAAKYISSSARLAADVPSASFLMAQLGRHMENADDLNAAEDLCVAFARGLLEASASLLVVRTDNSESVKPVELSLRRLADHFGARLAVVDSDLSIAVLPAARWVPGGSPNTPEIVDDRTAVVLTDGPVFPGSDLSLIQSFAETLVARGSC